MSLENVEIVRAAVDHYNATGDLPWETIDPEIEWVIDPAGFMLAMTQGASTLIGRPC